MKRILALLFAVLLLMGLTGCNSYTKTLKSAKNIEDLSKAIQTANEKNGELEAFTLSGEMSALVSNVSIKVPFDLTMVQIDENKSAFSMNANVTGTDITLYSSDAQTLYIGVKTQDSTEKYWLKCDLENYEDMLEDAGYNADAELDEDAQKLEAFVKEKLGDDNGISFLKTLIASFSNTADYTYNIKLDDAAIKSFISELYNLYADPTTDETFDEYKDAISFGSPTIQIILNDRGRIEDLRINISLTDTIDNATIELATTITITELEKNHSITKPVGIENALDLQEALGGEFGYTTF